MAKKKKVHIVGAGLSGMVAAINLAREGYQVTVLERAKSIGGIRPHHPSNHSSPLDLELIKNYLGIDITPCLTPCNNMYMYAYSRKYHIPAWDGFSMERGPRKTSLDTLLYNLAIELGVTFEFGQEVKKPFDLPDPTIIATGLFQEMHEVLKRPAIRLPCFSATVPLRDPNRQGEIRSWFGPYTNTYAYSPIINGLCYILLFSNRDLSVLNLKIFEDEVDRVDKIRLDHWDYFEVYVPMGSPDAPKLFAGSKILAGTLSGMMEPGAYCGIHGALVSGKIAALAVTDPEKAAKDFKSFNSGYKQCWYMNRYMNNPQRQYFFRLFFHFPAIFTPFFRLTDTGIPGIDHYNTGLLPKYIGRY